MYEETEARRQKARVPKSVQQTIQPYAFEIAANAGEPAESKDLQRCWAWKKHKPCPLSCGLWHSVPDRSLLSKHITLSPIPLQALLCHNISGLDPQDLVPWGPVGKTPRGSRNKPCRWCRDRRRQLQFFLLHPRVMMGRCRVIPLRCNCPTVGAWAMRKWCN